MKLINFYIILMFAILVPSIALACSVKNWKLVYEIDEWGQSVTGKDSLTKLVNAINQGADVKATLVQGPVLGAHTVYPTRVGVTDNESLVYVDVITHSLDFDSNGYPVVTRSLQYHHLITSSGTWAYHGYDYNGNLVVSDTLKTHIQFFVSQ